MGANPIGSATPRRGTAIKEAESRPATEQVPGALLVPPGRLSAWCRSNIPGLGPGERRCKSCRTDHSQWLPSPKQTRPPSSKRTDAGATPAGSATAQWDNSSPPGCYPGRCWCDSSLSSQRLRRIANWLSVIGYSRAARSEGRQIQAGCTCLENRTGASRGGGSTRAFRQSPLLELPLGGPTQNPKRKATHDQTRHPPPKPFADPKGVQAERQTQTRAAPAGGDLPPQPRRSDPNSV